MSFVGIKDGVIYMMLVYRKDMAIMKMIMTVTRIFKEKQIVIKIIMVNSIPNSHNKTTILGTVTVI